MSRFSVRMARRELRGSGRRIVLYGSCMALGIAALVALSGLRLAVTQVVDARARELMGADFMLRARSPFSTAIEAEIETLGRSGQWARVTSFASMARAEASGRTRLVHVHAVEPGFPLHGEVVTDPPLRWESLHEAAHAMVDPALLIQLDLEIGEALRIGQVEFTVRASTLKAPGTFGLRASIAPRVFIPAALLEATGLVQQGSLVEYLAYFRLGDTAQEDGLTLPAWLDEKRSLLAAERTTARTLERYQRDLSNSFATLTRYLGLIGLTALLLGGVGVAAGVRVFVAEKLDNAALLRALGARSGQVSRIYLAQAALLGAGGGLIGVAGGYTLQAFLPILLADFLPVDLSFEPNPWVGLVGFGLGVLLAVLFAAWPLVKLHQVSPFRALRRNVDSSLGSRAGLAIGVMLVCVLVATSLWQAPTARTGWLFAAGVLVALAVLATAARGLSAGLRRFFPRSSPFWLRQGIANLFRPRNHTLATTLTLGFGLFLVASVQLLEANLLNELERDASSDRPNLILFDVQRDQLSDVLSLLEDRGTRIDAEAPMVPARIELVRGEPTSELSLDGNEEESWDEAEPEAGWALRREYRLTYRAELTETETLVAGEWWDGQKIDPSRIPVSLEDELADRLGVRVGDDLTWNVQGVQVQSVVANLRDVDWGRFSTNFFVVFPPGVLEAAPQSVILLGHLGGETPRAELQRDLVGAFPNVSVIDATRLLATVDKIVGQVSLVVRFMALFTLATGLVVLLAAASASRFERLREAYLLRTLGAQSRTVRRVLTSESFVLGAVSASTGLLLATLTSWALVRFWFEQAFALPAADLVVLWFAAVGVSTVLGALHLGGALSSSPLAGLRRSV